MFGAAEERVQREMRARARDALGESAFDCAYEGGALVSDNRVLEVVLESLE
jgi:hypothetical protein